MENRSEPGYEGLAGGGFTLVEVLVAMVILVVGLMGLQALGIGAARSIALAERQSRYATIAGDSLESAMDQLRRRVIPARFCQVDLPHGDRVSREVDLSNPMLARVTVAVLPNQSSPNAPREPFTVSSSLYLPVTLVGTPAGQACS